MRENPGFLLICCLLTAGFFIGFIDEIADSFYLLLFLPLGFATWIALLILAAFRIVKRSYLPWSRRLVPLYGLLIPIGSLIIFWIFGLIWQDITYKPEWLVLKSYDFRGSDAIRLMSDGEFSSWRDRPLGQSFRMHGRYERHDSLIMLGPDRKEGTYRKLHLAIRPYTRFETQHNDSAVVVVALDNAGNNWGYYEISKHIRLPEERILLNNYQ